MLLFLIRHARAAEPSPERADARRPLTAAGRRKFTAEVEGARSLGWRFDRLYHSPLTRAVQTAELLAPLVSGPVRELPGLASAPDPALLAELAGERVALVGHQPHLSLLLAWLTTGELARGDAFALKKGGVAVLAGPLRPGAMALQALLPPSLLRALAG